MTGGQRNLQENPLLRNVHHCPLFKHLLSFLLHRHHKLGNHNRLRLQRLFQKEQLFLITYGQGQQEVAKQPVQKPLFALSVVATMCSAGIHEPQLTQHLVATNVVGTDFTHKQTK